MRAVYNGNSGECLVRWNGVPKRRSYVVQQSIDPIGPDTWQNVPDGEVGKLSLLITGLTTGTAYWFRVITYGTAGFSAPSDPARIMAV
ncbi:MAG TPA: fibronectin type III domain-containing protein [Bacteroidia bacterium]|nr:fibronectin type III domain-containing protein [Bacteroidia bacterium]